MGTTRTYRTEGLLCPYCGYLHGDPQEIFSEIEQTIDEFQCEHCEKIFTAQKEVSVSYSR